MKPENNNDDDEILRIPLANLENINWTVQNGFELIIVTREFEMSLCPSNLSICSVRDWLL
jgi:hypothetical protein